MSAKILPSNVITINTAAPQALSTASPEVVAKKIILLAPVLNAGFVYIGDETTDAATQRGVQLVEGVPLVIDLQGEFISLNEVYVHGTVNGDKVTVSYISRS